MKAWLLLMLAVGAVRAQTKAPPPAGQESQAPPQPSIPPRPTNYTPAILKPIVHPIPKGMLLIIPIVDTDPNRGTSWGVLPVWALRDGNPSDIRQIHAPSIDYNPTFRTTVTYRYFLYPKRDAQYNFRAAISQVIEHEMMAQFKDMSLGGTRWAAGGRAQWNIDGSNRFFGIGPATSFSRQTNYTEDYLGYKFYVGHPLIDGLYLYGGQLLQGYRITNGPIRSLPPTGELFPDDVTGHRHENGAEKIELSYDTRDDPDTTTRGVYADFSEETAQRRIASEYTYQRYAVDLRGFLRRGGEHRMVTAARFRFEQMDGPDAPFWLQPSLGGKYTLRAYGNGRFTDRGMMLSGLEERFLVYKRAVSGTAAELEVGPFIEAGTVFRSAPYMATRYIRPAYGGAVRAVARPQIVVSIDFGVGQEGMAAFMDINYSF